MATRAAMTVRNTVNVDLIAAAVVDVVEIACVASDYAAETRLTQPTARILGNLGAERDIARREVLRSCVELRPPQSARTSAPLTTDRSSLLAPVAGAEVGARGISTTGRGE
jgi:hypothetical protein